MLSSLERPFESRFSSNWRSTVGPAALLIRNDAAPKIEDLQTKLLDLHEQLEAIQATADALQ